MKQPRGGLVGAHRNERKETRNKKLVGKEATQLSPDNYGAAEWWLRLEPTSS